MGWLYNRNYSGPDRRAKRFQMRFLERRSEGAANDRKSLQDRLGELGTAGLRWVDHIKYFGPDRRSGLFSHFILERRKQTAAGPPPALHAALRQLRVRVLDVDDTSKRPAFRERVVATALLADLNGQSAVGDLLLALVAALDAAEGDRELSATLQTELLAAEARLADGSIRSR